jgi:anti-anti-sigma regulatory factor
MLRITSHITADTVTLYVEGTLAGPWVKELQLQLESHQRPVCLDLAGVSFIDSQGAALIENAIFNGTALKAASHFVALMLQKSSPETSNSSARKEG